MKKYSTLSLLFFMMSISLCFAQGKENNNSTSLLEKKIIRLNLLSPSVGLELRTSEFTSLTFSTGITYFGSIHGMNDELKSGSQTGWVYSFEPFLNVEKKIFYNLQKRKDKGKSTAYNSGNFISFRSLTSGPAIEGNVNRQSDYDFMFLASWGIQRSYNRIHFLFDAGPLFVFDGKGNSGFFPLYLRVNLGYNF